MSTPLRFERIFLEKVWGGRALERSPGIALPEGLRVGETLEVVDRANENSVVAGGPDAGRTLRELLEQRAGELLGSASPTPGGRFPLLVKYIDAKENLSIQVHPDDAAAARMGDGAEGKSEAWFVLAAEPGAVVYAGLEPHVTREDLFARLAEPGVEELLASWTVQPGDVLTVPGGTVHAIGAGVTLLEVQQNSDTTYRVHDWGRMGLDGRPRATHVEQALEVATFGARPRPPVRSGAAGWTADGAALRRARVSRNDHFAMDVLEVRGTAELGTGGRFSIYVAVAGTGRIERASDAWPLTRGDTWLLPASFDSHQVVPDGDSLTLVRLSATR
jgi:mannose-6-phosphate isomerase